MTTGALRVLHTSHADEWKSVLGRTAQHDVYHLPEYHRVSEQRGDGVAHLFVYSEGPHLVAIPLLLRRIDGAEGGEQDATSVYGYSGPVASATAIPDSVVGRFQLALEEALRERGVVTAFSRLHPLLPQYPLLAGLGECRQGGLTVSIDLTESANEQWSAYRKSCRHVINRLRRDGFEVLHDVSKRYLPEFIDVYRETMVRAHAEPSYLFDVSYFEHLTRELGETLQLFVVFRGTQVAAASLVTVCQGIVQDYLGGTRNEFLHDSPDRLVVDAERRWALGVGARVHHLGGGVGARRDSLFDYKAGFSSRRHAFSTWCCVLDAWAYHDLCGRHARLNERAGLAPRWWNYFPEYRCPTTPAPHGVTRSRPSTREPTDALARHAVHR
jgi:Acetyltransferase (GNAT) domain